MNSLSLLAQTKNLNNALFLRYGATLDSSPSELVEARRKQEVKVDKHDDQDVEREMQELKRELNSFLTDVSTLGEDTRVVGVEELSEAELDAKLEEEVERSSLLVQRLQDAHVEPSGPEQKEPEQKVDLGASIDVLLHHADQTLQNYLPEINHAQEDVGGAIASSQHHGDDKSGSDNSLESMNDSNMDASQQQDATQVRPTQATRSAAPPPRLPQLQLCMLQPQPPMAQAEYRSRTPKELPAGQHSDVLPPFAMYDSGQGYLAGHSAQHVQNLGRITPQPLSARGGGEGKDGYVQQEHVQRAAHSNHGAQIEHAVFTQQQQQATSRQTQSGTYIQKPVPPLPQQQQDTSRTRPPQHPGPSPMEQRGAITPRQTATAIPGTSYQQVASTTPRISQQPLGNTQQHVSSMQQQFGTATTPRLSQHGNYAQNAPPPIMTQRPPLPTPQQQQQQPQQQQQVRHFFCRSHVCTSHVHMQTNVLPTFTSYVFTLKQNKNTHTIDFHPPGSIADGV